ncbi:hypothetical protein C1701_02435 [Actinoalloteichus sp. AHMU CJ021]|nr:hypothetical protein C1701_02435 [Actinoalloteichus sp. AHMU CJ021]
MVVEDEKADVVSPGAAPRRRLVAGRAGPADRCSSPAWRARLGGVVPGRRPPGWCGADRFSDPVAAGSENAGP